MFAACLLASCSSGASEGSSEGFDGGGIDSSDSGSGSTTSSGSSGGSSAGGVTNDDGSMGTSSGGVFADAGPCDACAPGAIYVAPNGNDANPGTVDRPIQTLARAKALVQPLLPMMSSDLVVYLRGGTYPGDEHAHFRERRFGPERPLRQVPGVPRRATDYHGRPARHGMEALRTRRTTSTR